MLGFNPFIAVAQVQFCKLHSIARVKKKNCVCVYIYISYISKALCQKIEFFPSVDLKKFHNIKVESYVLLGVGSGGGKNFKNSSPGDNPVRIALRRGGLEPGYTEVLPQRADSLNLKRKPDIPS